MQDSYVYYSGQTLLVIILPSLRSLWYRKGLVSQTNPYPHTSCAIDVVCVAQLCLHRFGVNGSDKVDEVKG